MMKDDRLKLLLVRVTLPVSVPECARLPNCTVPVPVKFKLPPARTSMSPVMLPVTSVVVDPLPIIALLVPDALTFTSERLRTTIAPPPAP